MCRRRRAAWQGVEMQVLIIGGDETRVWGLNGRQRLQRMLARLPGARAIETPAGLAGGEDVLLLDAGWIYDLRLLKALAAPGPAVALVPAPGAAPVAARCAAEAAPALLQELAGGGGSRLQDMPARLPREFDSGFERSLRKLEPPHLFRIRAAAVPQIEAELFGGAYKGITDFVTKWWWPAPAAQVTRWCVRRGITPNQVTLCGLVLAILAGVCFAFGWFGPGLLCGWIMTFLDTVDGKLARVTVSSSRFGDFLDHGIDLIHPPLWYVAWGMGLASGWQSAVSLPTLYWLMLAGYIGGRLCEGAFHLLVGKFSLFMWQPLDSFNRLVTARRNPNMLLLTVAWLAGQPAAGLWAVVIWHLLSTGFLAVRVLQGLAARLRGATLRPWLEGIDPLRDRERLAVRVFTRVPAELHDAAGQR